MFFQMGADILNKNSELLGRIAFPGKFDANLLVDENRNSRILVSYRGLVFSFPNKKLSLDCLEKNGEYSIIWGLLTDVFQKQDSLLYQILLNETKRLAGNWDEIDFLGMDMPRYRNYSSNQELRSPMHYGYQEISYDDEEVFDMVLDKGGGKKFLEMYRYNEAKNRMIRVKPKNPVVAGSYGRKRRIIKCCIGPQKKEQKI